MVGGICGLAENCANECFSLSSKLVEELPLTPDEVVEFDDAFLLRQIGNRDLKVLKGRYRDHSNAGALRLRPQPALRVGLVDRPGQVFWKKLLSVWPNDYQRDDDRRWFGQGFPNCDRYVRLAA